MTTSPDKLKENRIRKLARRHGYLLRKSHQRRYVPNSCNCGLYMLVDAKGQIVVGARFDASLEHIERCLEHITEGLYPPPAHPLPALSE